MAQSAEAVAKVAQTITVRIEGATQGSGVLVKRDGNRYTVLSAWHVVSGQRPGEELDIYTPDGQRHKIEQGSIKRLGEVDMAVLSFSSSNSYELAKIGDVKSVNSGDQVLVAGFPVGSNGRLKYDSGKLVANAAVGIDQGYQLLYTNDTVSGMSGGVVIKADGTLIGMHGRGELDEQKSQQSGLTIKTGTNQGVPIAYYSLFDAGAPVVASTSQATTADDYLAQAKALLGKKGSQQEVIRLTNQALTTRQSADAYFYRAFTKGDLGDNQGAIADYNQAIAINPQIAAAYGNRGIAKSALGDQQGAIDDYNQVIAINPQDAKAYRARGSAKSALGDKQGAIADYNKAIAINPQNATGYVGRGLTKSALGDKQGAINDYNQAIAINPQDAEAWAARGISKSQLGDRLGACEDARKSASLGSSVAQRLLPQVCQ
jgi:Flp pilus assembly protein TadD